MVCSGGRGGRSSLAAPAAVTRGPVCGRRGGAMGPVLAIPSEARFLGNLREQSPPKTNRRGGDSPRFVRGGHRARRDGEVCRALGQGVPAVLLTLRTSKLETTFAREESGRRPGRSRPGWGGCAELRSCQRPASTCAVAPRRATLPQTASGCATRQARCGAAGVTPQRGFRSHRSGNRHTRAGSGAQVARRTVPSRRSDPV